MVPPPNPPASSEHALVFAGTYQIKESSGTGRFAGATGTGVLNGWADYDDATMSGGQGYWQFSGNLTLPEKPHCGGRK